MIALRSVGVRLRPGAVGWLDLDVPTGAIIVIHGDRTGSVLLRTLAGALPPIGASAAFNDDTDLLTLTPAQRRRAGVEYVATPAAPNAAPVTAWLALGAARHQPWNGDAAARARRIAQVLDRFPTLAARRDRASSSLNPDDAALLALAVAVAARPRLLLVDGLLDTLNRAARAEATAAITVTTDREDTSVLVAHQPEHPGGYLPAHRVFTGRNGVLTSAPRHDADTGASAPVAPSRAGDATPTGESVPPHGAAAWPPLYVQ
ncbi:MAG TPA: hypothetical protein VFQ85_08220 [Mycobacteriales bacterium]|nr:hypothetical protein [Mycobacteriales bacterium]